MVQEVDRITRLLPAMSAQMRRMICRSVLALDDIEGTMRHIAWIALSERAATARKRSIRVNFLGSMLPGQNI
jgi:hypothetical protein